ncbi:MAG: hypothetical protein IKR48_03970, partial [Kiritimatiellae bacterium]|nr:hypothetical protein [Kiritimatiellia bacterium]
MGHGAVHGEGDRPPAGKPGGQADGERDGVHLALGQEIGVNMPGTVGIVWTVVILGLLFLCALVRMAERRTTRRVLSGFRPWCQTERVAVTASSDHPAVTNSVSTYNLLGRLVSTAVPGANGGALVTSNLYDGATSRIVTATKTGSLPVNYAYDEFGERIGMIKGNRSVWNRTTYETVSQEVYRVVTTVRMTGSTT